MGVSVLLSIWCGLVLHFVACRSSIEEEDRILKRVLDTKVYDPHVRAGNEEGRTEVKTNLYVRNFNAVDIKNMDYTVDITFRQEWLDSRLKYNSSSLKYLFIPKENAVWKPDTFFRNEKESSFHLVPNKQFYVKLFPDGKVLYSIRLKIKLVCGMNFRSFPFDIQTCPMQIASYGHSTDTLSYRWKDIDPVQISNRLYLPNFSLKAFKSSTCNVITATGEYSCLSVDFVFDNVSSYLVVKDFIPFTMLIAISWTSFWVKQKDILVRIGINLAVLLMASAKCDNINEALPTVAYTKAIDVWTGVCIFFMFSSLITCILINWLAGEEKEENETKLSIIDQFKNAPLALKINYSLRILFPLLFLIFSIIYSCYWMSEGYQCKTGELEQTSCNQLY